MNRYRALPETTHQKFLQIAASLSPENLLRDGDVFPSEAEREYNRLMSQWHALEREIGFQVKEEEVLDWELEKTGQF